MTPPRDAEQHQAEQNVLWPVAKETDVAHELAPRGTLMLRHEITHRIVKIKRARNRDRRDDDADQPIKSRSATHN